MYSYKKEIEQVKKIEQGVISLADTLLTIYKVFKLIKNLQLFITYKKCNTFIKNYPFVSLCNLYT